MHFQPVIQHLSRKCLRKICRRSKLLSPLRLAKVAKETLRRHLEWYLGGWWVESWEVNPFMADFFVENVIILRGKREEKCKSGSITKCNMCERYWNMVSIPLSLPVCTTCTTAFSPLLVVKGGLASLPQRKCLKPGPFQDDDCRAIWMNDGLVGGKSPNRSNGVGKKWQ